MQADAHTAGLDKAKSTKAKKTMKSTSMKLSKFHHRTWSKNTTSIGPQSLPAKGALPTPVVRPGAWCANHESEPSGTLTAAEVRRPMAQASYLECYPYKKCITQSRKEREEDDEQEHEVEIRNASHDSAHRRKSTKTMVPACATSMHGDARCEQSQHSRQAEA